MFEKFSPLSRSAWIETANQEAGQGSPVPFPYTFTLDELSLEAINTSEDFSPSSVHHCRMPGTWEKPLISLWIPKPSENQDHQGIKAAVAQGAEDLFIQDPFSLLDELPLLASETSALRSLSLDCASNSAEALPASIKGLSNREQFGVSLYSDQLSKVLMTELPADLIDVTSYEQTLNRYPHIRGLGMSGYAFGNAGATVVQELACTLSWTVYHWDQLEALGPDLDTWINRTEIALSLGSDFYTDLTKFRAMRTLLYYVLDAYRVVDPNPYRIPLRAMTSTINKTVYDPDGNLLRNTTEGLAATLGGAQFITLRSHDVHYRSNSVFGQRMALNLQHLLRHEAHLHQVHNPVDGSYFLERATKQLIEKSWEAFLEIEQQGGIHTWLAGGKLQAIFRDNITRKRLALTAQKRIVVGVTRYTNGCQKIDRKEVDLTSLRHSWAAEIEQLRLRVDQLLEEEKPVLVLIRPVSTENNAKVTQRLTYVTDIITSLGLSLYSLDDTSAEGLQAHLQSRAVQGVLFCADDGWYQQALQPLLQAISSFAVVKVAVGKSSVLAALQADHLVDVLLHPQADLTGFYHMINSMLHEA